MQLPQKSATGLAKKKWRTGRGGGSERKGGGLKKKGGGFKKTGGGLNRKDEGLKKQGRVEKKGLEGEKKGFPVVQPCQSRYAPKKDSPCDLCLKGCVKKPPALPHVSWRFTTCQLAKESIFSGLSTRQRVRLGGISQYARRQQGEMLTCPSQCSVWGGRVVFSDGPPGGEELVGSWAQQDGRCDLSLSFFARVPDLSEIELTVRNSFWRVSALSKEVGPFALVSV